MIFAKVSENFRNSFVTFSDFQGENHYNDKSILITKFSDVPSFDWISFSLAIYSMTDYEFYLK